MYFTEEDKLAYITACIEHCWDKGRPVLIGTTSVNESEKVREDWEIGVEGADHISSWTFVNWATLQC